MNMPYEDNCLCGGVVELRVRPSLRVRVPIGVLIIMRKIVCLATVWLLGEVFLDFFAIFYPQFMVFMISEQWFVKAVVIQIADSSNMSRGGYLQLPLDIQAVVVSLKAIMQMSHISLVHF
jgi:hypothetical protein